VPGVVVGMTVAVVLAVRLAVLVVVRDEVVQAEAVMGGDEVDARPWLPAALAEQVAGSGDAWGEIGQLAILALPEGAHCVAELVVPFRPAGRELADLVATGADIPRLGDQLHARKHRILPAGVEKPAPLVEPVRLPR